MDIDLSSLSFLIVDDDVSAQELVSHRLKQLNVGDIVIADNGKIALEKLQANTRPIDIIVCDLDMPEMDGVQFLRHLSEQGYPGGIILLSGVDRNILRSAHRLAREHALNILGSISKQVELKEIKSFIKQIDFTKKQPAKKIHFPVSKNELSNALEKQQIEYVFQPKIKISSGKIAGVEVLARWNHPDYGDISPDQFIQLAEQSELIDKLTKLVCVKGIEQARQWLDKGIDIKISVNASAASLEKLDFADFVVQLIRQEKVPFDNVIIEVTETQLMQDISAHLETLTRLGMSGVRLSIDDFGKGYSTLEQLERIPFTELKIDRDFVTGVRDDSSSIAILESTFDLARKLQIETVAEGVETRDDWALVEAMGCDYVQGYYIAKAMTGDEFEEWYLKRHGQYQI